MISLEPDEQVVPQQKLQVLLQQYRECSAHHVCMYQLMWQVPTVTVTASWRQRSRTTSLL